MKLFNLILGVFAILCSIYCIFYPGIMFLRVGWIVTILMGVWGVCAIFDYFVSKNDETKTKKDMSKGVASVIAAVIAIILSIIAVVIPRLSLLMDMIIIAIFIMWLITSGLNSILLSIKIKRANIGKMWIFSLIMGIIVLISGIIGFFNIISVAKTIGFTIGILIMIWGIRLILSVFEVEDV